MLVKSFPGKKWSKTLKSHLKKPDDVDDLNISADEKYIIFK